MQQTRTMELGTGLFVLLGIGALFFLTTQTTGNSDFDADETFEVTARFENVGSLKTRAPVSMSGVTIGRGYPNSVRSSVAGSCGDVCD